MPLLFIVKRPRPGAFFVSSALSLAVLGASAATPPTPLVGQISTTFEQLRVTQVADGLIRYLDQAVKWVEQPNANMPLAQLTPLIQAAVSAHPEVRLSSAQRATATLATREAYAGFLPQVSANVESGKRNYQEVNTPWNYSPAYSDSSKAVALSARQLLYDFGAVSNQVDARTALEKAAGARSELKSSELALRAITAWLEMFRGRQLVALTQMNVQSRQQILSFIEERERLGGSAQSDVLRARARLSDAQVAAVAAQTRLATAEAVYREVFNAPPPAQLGLPQLAALDMPRYANVSDVMLRSAHLAEARAQTEAAGFEAKSAAAALLPSFVLDVTARRRDLGGQGVPGTDWTAGINVKQNLYSGGAETARKQQAEQRAIESQLAQDNVQRQLERALMQAVADVENSTASVSARKDAAKVAAVALEAVREQFAFRRGSLLDLLRAQEELYIAGRDLIDGVAEHSLVRYRLLHLATELNAVFDIPVGKE
ncbi:MAG: TolC family protein [Rhodoferax sp.]|uniref:TolC family protein n=1 Tax=Rhodoferax sp. TaxID=50421 RepID=UPI002734F011|nr:TolC family protein [Rhodoferax sp.]MDP2678542.1 TolC family protein [Rhodoferax sp.]